ncbi:hypothetical protein CLU96_1227 [Chryseobacterium sp. 52]|uniref:hypothetical protein n=1 Tax=Chryseobacterium sp. 52 TaxID=2035213 RepID=UPI000C3E27E8|nr:hypothetical protein [Chryseobacterium sp. 52]PIF44286.1 hypothetical protein CLU96_1227 [Chryseobacterium sp. 52]
MKSLILMLISFMAFSQPGKIDTIGLSPEIKIAVTEVALEKEKSDQLDKKIKQAEIRTAALKKRIEALVKKSIQKNRIEDIDHEIAYKYTSDKIALKPNYRLIYWEEIRRKWIGRLLSKNHYKIRLYEFKDGEKVYLD